MKQCIPSIAIFVSLLFLCCISIAQPTVDQFKQQFFVHLQKLKSSEVIKRNVSFVQVVKSAANGGYYSFRVTAYVHDYSPGYPSNHYYGQTCVSKFDGLKYDMLADGFGGWTIQGTFTPPLSETKCLDNESEGSEAIPLSSIQGSLYNSIATNRRTETINQPKTITNNNSSLYIGEYSCYGTGNRLLAGMGFKLKPNGTYVDLENKRGGIFTYNVQAATISFKGGFLAGQVGRNVRQTGFQISNTVTAEPWR